jgi:hypothetical protein
MLRFGAIENVIGLIFKSRQTDDRGLIRDIESIIVVSGLSPFWNACSIIPKVLWIDIM